MIYKVIKKRLDKRELWKLSVVLSVVLLEAAFWIVRPFMTLGLDYNTPTTLIYPRFIEMGSIPLFFLLLILFFRDFSTEERIRIKKVMQFRYHLIVIFISGIIVSLIPILTLIIFTFFKNKSEILALGLLMDIFIRSMMFYYTLGLIQYLFFLWISNHWYAFGIVYILEIIFSFLSGFDTIFQKFANYAFLYLIPPTKEIGQPSYLLFPFFLGTSTLLGVFCYYKLIKQDYLS